MALKTSYSDENIIVEEPLKVTYSTQIISGSWGWTSANMSGYYTRMRENHRYATKRFRYVGMTHAAALTCRDELIEKFTRNFNMSIWNGDVTDGEWVSMNGGAMCMADVSPEENGDGSYDVIVNVNEDDTKYSRVETPFYPNVAFATERLRTYGSDGHGTEDEVES